MTSLAVRERLAGAGATPTASPGGAGGYFKSEVKKPGRIARDRT